MCAIRGDVPALHYSLVPVSRSMEVLPTASAPGLFFSPSLLCGKIVTFDLVSFLNLLARAKLA